MGEKESILWPEINEEFLREEKVNFVIQINGKTREIIKTNKDITEKALIVKINENLKLLNHIKGKTIKKKIFIPNKLINIITI